MPDYENMEAVEALRHAKEVSGLTVDEISAMSGIPAATIRKYLRSDPENREYLPSIGKVPDLSRAFGNNVLLKWQEAKIARKPEDIPAAQSRAEVLTGVARLSATLGDIQRTLADSAVSGIDPHLARDIRGLTDDLMDEARVVKAMLQPIAQHDDKRACPPLASMQDGKKAVGSEHHWWERACRNFFMEVKKQ